MAGFKTMTDMKRTDAEKAESMIACAMPCMPDDYPYGLRISLTEEELEKLEIDPNCAVGDTIHLAALCTVTSCSETKTNGKTTCRIELTITHLAVESEDEEAKEAMPSKAARRYGDSDEDE